MTSSVGVALITHKARHHLPYCLPPLLNSPLKPHILLVNSSSSDGTVELAKAFGVETLVIPRPTFNHGLTRELARKTLNTDIVVMMTPDAYAKDCYALGKLIEPLIQGKAVCAYGRQIPHENAGIFEAFSREFNYPQQSQIRSIEEINCYGVYTFFFSDSFGAYLNSALDEIGGFDSVLTGEDTVACAKLLRQGFKVAYVAEAEAHHSHAYTLLQEFKRHFDTGLARESYRNLLKGSDKARGKQYVYELLKQLVEERNYHLIPYALLQSFIKWMGYKIGQNSQNVPKGLKRWLSSQDFYWDSVHNPDDKSHVNSALCIKAFLTNSNRHPMNKKNKREASVLTDISTAHEEEE